MNLSRELALELLIEIPHGDMLNLAATHRRMTAIYRKNRDLIYRRRMEREFPEVKAERSEKNYVYSLKLRKEFPYWGIVGDPKEHYQNILEEKGTPFVSVEYADKYTLKYIDVDEDMDEDMEPDFTVLGNKPLSGSVYYVAKSDTAMYGPDMCSESGLFPGVWEAREFIVSEWKQHYKGALEECREGDSYIMSHYLTDQKPLEIQKAEFIEYLDKGPLVDPEAPFKILKTIHRAPDEDSLDFAIRMIRELDGAKFNRVKIIGNLPAVYFREPAILEAIIP